MAELLPWPRSQFFDDNGDPLAGGKLYSYRAGSSIPLATYADKAASVPNANPVVLNSRGEALIYLSAQSYKLVLKDANDATVWTHDNFVVTQTDTETLAEAIADAQAAQAAAEAAQASAETAETNAETAQAAAEAAKAGAEAAETNAETAQAAAEAAQAAAAASESSASTSAATATTQAGIATTQAGLAATAKTAAETAETNAETAQAAAEAAAAGAATSEVNAAASAVAAAASAASAASAAAGAMWATLVSVTSASSPVTLTSADSKKLYLMDTSGGSIQFTLPAPAAGLLFTFKDVGGALSTNAATLVRNAAEQIEGVADSYTLEAAYGVWTFVCDGTDWFIL